MTGFEFYSIYLPAKLHLFSNYDTTKYFGVVPKIDARYATLQNQAIFEKWGSKIVTKRECWNLCVANFMEDNQNWIYGTTQDGVKISKEFRRVQDDFKKYYAEDLKTINTIMTNRNIQDEEILFHPTPSGNLPPLLQLYLAKRVLPDTILQCFIDKGRKLPYWIEIYKDDPVVSKELFKLNKYRPFRARLVLQPTE